MGYNPHKQIATDRAAKKAVQTKILTPDICQWDVKNKKRAILKYKALMGLCIALRDEFVSMIIPCSPYPRGIIQINNLIDSITSGSSENIVAMNPDDKKRMK